MRAPLAVLALAAVLLPVAGCASSRDRAGKPTKGFYAPDSAMLWEVTRREMKRAGFTPDLDASTTDQMLVSRWDSHLYPFSNKGYREQATITLVPDPDKTGWWTAEANVTREWNTEVREPLNPAKAKWERPERVADKETRIVAAIESFFLGRDVSDRFRADYDVPSDAPAVPPTRDPSKTR
ncbi:MAG: hypothetical protein IT460_11195 [Planctomycetes bacterium]|nr:hypothetical protein [Planctomycetota bacterium]